MEVDESCCTVFLSGQAALHIPEFPSFFCTNTYTPSVQLFPVEGKEVGREVKVFFWILLLDSQPYKTQFPHRSLQCT